MKTNEHTLERSVSENTRFPAENSTSVKTDMKHQRTNIINRRKNKDDIF